MSAVELVLATHNLGKLRELRAQLEGAGLGNRIVVLSAADVGAPIPVEDAATFEGNARKKAREVARASGRACLADDSGLCVDALGGRPGVESARYAATDEGRIERLLEELEGVELARRRARFESVLCLSLPSGEERVEAGRCEGWIALGPKGSGGFGYDPVFWVEELGKTMAELSIEEKAAISHRGKALSAMLPHLRMLG